jgi:hypothetical protein
MDKIIGETFETGLGDLKKPAEAESVPKPAMPRSASAS